LHRFKREAGNPFYSESDADAYGIRKMREWRAIHGPKDITELGGIDLVLESKILAQDL
jgi:hypothetical protein